MEDLLKNQKTLMLSTIAKNHEPAISYAPYIMKASDIYIYISQTANHYQNLMDNPACAIMIIEDEHEAKTIFARQRVSFIADATHVKEDEEVYQWFKEIQDEKMVERLRQMDFSFFKLTIKKGRLVKGFGQASDIIYENDVPKITPIESNGLVHQFHSTK